MKVTMRQLNILEILFQGGASSYAMIGADLDEAGLNGVGLKETLKLMVWKKWIIKNFDGRYEITEAGKTAMNGKHTRLAKEELANA